MAQHTSHPQRAWRLALVALAANAFIVACGGRGSVNVDAPNDVYPNPGGVPTGNPIPTPASPSVTMAADGSKITGSAQAGMTVVVTGPGGAVLGSTTAGAGGSYSINLSPALTNGEMLSVVAKNAAGASSLPTVVAAPQLSGSDTTAPSAPTALVSPNGSQVTGRAEVGSVITVTGPGGVVLGSTTTGSDGNYSLTLSPAQSNGQTLNVTAKDAAGNTSTPTTVTAPDTTLPLPPSASISASGDQITGTAEPGSTVTVTGPGGAVLGSTTAAPDGSYSLSISPAQTNGQTLNVTAKDAAGNTSTPTTVTAPDTTVPLPPSASVSAAGNQVTGTAEPGSTVTVTGPGGAALGSTTAAPDGSYSLSISPAQTNGQTLHVTAQDAAGNTSTPTTATAPDTTAPAAPLATISGSGDQVTGTAEPGSTVTVTGPGGAVLGSTTAAPDGSYSLSISPAQTNGETLNVTAKDAAGNPSAPTTVTAPVITPTPTNTHTPTPTPTNTNTPVPTATNTNTPVPTATNTNTPVPTATNTNTPVPTATNTNTPVPTATNTNTPVPTATNTNTPVPTATNTNTPVPTATNTNTPVPTATNTNTPVPTATNTNTPVPTATNTNTPVPTATNTNTPVPTATNTNTPVPTATNTNTPVPTATNTNTPVPTATNTNTPVPTATNTNTPVPTATNTNTPVPTATNTNTPVPTATNTNTPVPTATNTNTPVPTATNTNTPVPTATNTNTPVPTATNTNTPVPTATNTNTPVPTATNTNTPVPTATNTNTPVPTATNTNTPIPTATNTNTPVPTATNTNTPVPTATNTNTPVPTATNTNTPVPTATDTATPVPTATNTNTPVPTATNTNTPVPTATNTNTPVPTATNTNTPIPTATNTNTPVPTATNTNTPVPTATNTNTPVPTATNTNTPVPTATNTNTPTPDVVGFDAGLPTAAAFLSASQVSASSSNGGTISYSSDTPSTCTVNASTGEVTINGGGAGDCTVRATSTAGGSNTHTITINQVTLDTVQCAPDAPRPGDNFNERFKARNSAYQTPRTFYAGGYTYAFDNPKIRALKDVTATFNYSDAGAGLLNLNTSNLSNSGAAANPPVPAGAWDGWMPLPVAGDTYVYNADGSVNSAPKRPAAAAPVALDSNLPAVQEALPSDWQRAFATKRDQEGTPAGQFIGGAGYTQRVTLRETGGFLNRWKHKQDVRDLVVTVLGEWGYTGASYVEVQYDVSAKFEGLVDMPLAAPTSGWQGGAVVSNNPQQDSQGQAISGAHGKVQYGKMCKISYRFTRVGSRNTATQANTADSAAWDGVAAVKTDAGATCNGTGCSNWATYGNGSSNLEKIANSIGDSYGDWVGTFYTHDKLPRIVKDFRSAIGRAANANAWQPGSGLIQMPMGNWAFFDSHNGNTNTSDTPSPTYGTTPPTQIDSLMTQANRLVFP